MTCKLILKLIVGPCLKTSCILCGYEGRYVMLVHNDVNEDGKF